MNRSSGSRITAKSPSYSNVRDAVNSAKPGDTVIVPAGSATWDEYLTITKGISIIGAGIGKTIITAGSEKIVYYTPDSTTRSNDYSFRLSGFTWRGSTTRVVDLYAPGSDRTPMRNVRIDHNRWETAGGNPGYPIYVRGNFWGCVDSNEFAGYNFFMILGPGVGNWFEFHPVSPGTVDNLYFEDNIFSGSGTLGIQSGQGGRWAFRHNIVNSTNMQNPMFDQHGNSPSSGGDLGSLMISEIYENIFPNFNVAARWDYQRGGQLIMYNNVGSSTTGTPNITVNFAKTSLGTVSPEPPIQYPQNSYFWGNLWRGIRVDATKGDDYHNPPVIFEDRVFWNQKDSFDGTSGIGVGLLAHRPLSCTLEGVGYWATDESKLYRWKSGAWERYYLPYTYPHPLRR